MTYSQGSDEIRTPEIQSLGVTYPHNLFNIVLLAVKPGYDEWAINEITDLLREHEGEKQYLRERYSELDLRRTTQSANPLNPPPGRVGGRKQGSQTFANFATIFGSFSLATFFESTGFGFSQRLGVINNVFSQQHIIGTAPSPLSSCAHRFTCLKQDPMAFFLADSNQDTETTKDSRNYTSPFVAVCQLQNVGIVNTSCGGTLTLPTMLAVEERIRAVISELPSSERDAVRSIYLNCFGWSDSCVLIRAQDINCIARCVNAIRAIRLKDIYEVLESLKQNGDKSMSVISQIAQHSFNRLDRVIGMLRKSPHERTEITSKQLDNHLFSKSHTLIGAFWPMAKDALNYMKLKMQNRQEHIEPLQDAQAPSAIVNYDRWNICGRIFAHTQVKVRPGHDSDAMEKLLSLPRHGYFSALRHFRSCHPQVLFGNTDICISWQVQTFSDEDEKRRCHIEPYETKSFIAELYYLRWILSGQPGDTSEEGWHPSHIYRLNTEIGCVYSATNAQRLSYPPESSCVELEKLFEKAVYQAFSAKGHPETVTPHSNLSKRKYISRYLRQALNNTIALWREKLVDHTLSNQMVELGDLYVPWLKLLRIGLDSDEFTTNDVEDVLRFFVGPFDEAVCQRFLCGHEMSEINDIVNEYKGGLAKNLIGLGGLAKSCIALDSGDRRIGTITLIGPHSNASVRMVNFDGACSEKRNISLSSTRINWTHLVQPYKLTIFLHEIVHVIVHTDDFTQAILSCQNGQRLHKAVRSRAYDSRDGLIAKRVYEMLVEYLVAALIFFDRPSLYTQVYLTNSSIVPEIHGNQGKINRMVEVEHVLRCFFTGCMLGDILVGVKFEQIENDFHKWWRANCRFFGNDLADDSEFESDLVFYMKKWVIDENLLSYFSVISECVGRYLGQPMNGSEKTSDGVRSSFYHTLKSVFSKNLVPIKNMLSGDDGRNCVMPVHFFFTAGDSGGPVRSLRTRRLESLIGYLTILRAFYEIIDEWIQAPEGTHLFAERSKNGRIEFNGYNYGPVVFDKIWGGPFILDEKYIGRYLHLRIAVMQSIWHIGEVTKHSDIMDLFTRDLSNPLAPSLSY